MLDRLAELVVAVPGRILSVVAAAVIGCALYGYDAASQLSPAGYEVPGSDSTRAAQFLADRFDTGPANVVVLVSVPTADDGGLVGGVDHPRVQAEGLAIADELAAVSGVEDVASYWATGSAALRSQDGSQALISARIVASEEEIYERVDTLRDEIAGPRDGIDVALGGSALMNLEVVEESERDLLRAELIAIPATTLIMLIVFRGVVAALLPLVVSAVAVTGTAAGLKLLSEATLVSIFALNLTTALGLGMGVDFSLFLLSRWREERANGRSPDDAVRAAVRIAGRSILFSGLTTAATLAALLLFDYPLLRSLALAGFVVVLLATLGALVALPATIALLGHRVEAGRIGRRVTTARPVEDGAWYRASMRIMGRPLVVGAAAVAFLIVLGLPFLRAQFSIPDDRVLPESSPARAVADELRTSFDGREFGALAVVAPDGLRGPTTMDAYATEVSAIEGVGRVDAAPGVYVGGERVADTPDPARFTGPGGSWLSVVPAVEPISPEAERVVAAIRRLPTSAAEGVLVGGEPGRLVDNKAEIRAKAPFVLLWVAAAIFILLYRAFGSILVPIKAFVLNLLSLTAAFGAIVWIFQDGRLSGLLGFTPTGLIDAQTPVLIFCIAFGLSMDYEVFLLSRIKEEWDRTGDGRRAVAVGLQRTGGIITAAAVLMAIVFLSFASGQVTFIQMVGVGLALAIVMDATVVRSLLVPAFMVVAGRWNWWSPSFSPPPRQLRLRKESS
ncbi:MAG: MMPL family transporter [Actinomycetota bacterium]